MAPTWRTAAPSTKVSMSSSRTGWPAASAAVETLRADRLDPDHPGPRRVLDQPAEAPGHQPGAADRDHQNVRRLAQLLGDLAHHGPLTGDHVRMIEGRDRDPAGALGVG